MRPLDLAVGQQHNFEHDGWVLGEDAQLARRDILMELLAASNLSLVWWLRGERRAWGHLVFSALTGGSVRFGGVCIH
ncbi:MAG: hypothetical protein ACRD98_09145 [Nitrososphaera sp.]